MGNQDYGKQITITGPVKFIGEGEDPKENLGFQIWEKALIEAVEKMKEKEKET